MWSNGRALGPRENWTDGSFGVFLMSATLGLADGSSGKTNPLVSVVVNGVKSAEKHVAENPQRLILPASL